MSSFPCGQECLLWMEEKRQCDGHGPYCVRKMCDWPLHVWHVNACLGERFFFCWAIGCPLFLVFTSMCKSTPPHHHTPYIYIHIYIYISIYLYMYIYIYIIYHGRHLCSSAEPDLVGVATGGVSNALVENAPS
jgi:hypothetical protein